MTETLQSKLDAFKAGFVSKVPADVLEVMGRATEELRASGQAARAVQPGAPLPAFSLPNQGGEIVRSEALLARGPLVLSYFRGAWCPYCMIELEALAAAAPAFAAEGASLVVVTPQSAGRSREMATAKGFAFDVLTDEGLAYAGQLGLVFELPAPVQAIYKGFGIDLPTHNGPAAGWRLPMPTRLVVGQDGRVRDAQIEADYTIRPDPMETLAVLRRSKAAA